MGGRSSETRLLVDMEFIHPEDVNWDQIVMAIVNTWINRYPKTAPTYATAFRRAWPLIRHGLGAVTVESVVEFQRNLTEQYAPATVNLTVSAMSSLWTEMMRRGLVQSNPWVLLHRVPVKDTVGERILKRSEVHKIVRAANKQRHQVLIRFLYLSAARISEAVALRWRDFRSTDSIPPQHFVTLFGKRGQTRTVEIPDRLYQDLLKLAPREATPDTWVFTTRTGHALTRQRAYQIMRQASVDADLPSPASPHWLRHSHATHAIENGATLKTVRDTLGHANVATTNRYLHRSPGDSSSLYLDDIRGDEPDT